MEKGRRRRFRVAKVERSEHPIPAGLLKAKSFNRGPYTHPCNYDVDWAKFGPTYVRQCLWRHLRRFNYVYRFGLARATRGRTLEREKESSRFGQHAKRYI